MNIDIACHCTAYYQQVAHKKIVDYLVLCLISLYIILSQLDEVP